jgi:hypothetical protein
VPAGERRFKALFKHNPWDPDMLAQVVACTVGSSRKQQTLRGRCSVMITELPRAAPPPPSLTRLDPSRNVLTPFPIDHQPAEGSTTQMVQFLGPLDTAVPHLDYVNNLYVFPHSLSIRGSGIISSARNLAVKVQLVEYTDGAPLKELAAIYGRSRDELFVKE